MDIEINEKEFSQRTFQQFMDLFVVPEIKLRQENDLLEKPFNLFAAQIIFFPDGRKPEVRLNAEVKAISEVILKDGQNRKPGDIVPLNDVIGIEKIKLIDHDDPDCGHVTLLKLNKSWHFTFDFRYNKNLSASHSKAANEFYEAAETAHSKKHWAAFIDNLFSACELAARSVLLSIPDPKFREKATHSSVHNRYNRSASIGNYQPERRETYNKLYSLRKKARYFKGKYSITNEEAKALLDGVKEMIEYSLLRSKT